MKKLSATIAGLLIFAAFLSLEARAETPNAPIPVNDGQQFHRVNDFAFGAVISGTVGPFTKPWIGLLAGEAAGVANEARYGKNFNMGHLAVISAGALTSYAICKLVQRHDQHKVNERYGR
jgi:hypothetical protein